MSLLFAGFEGRFATIDDTRGKATSQCAVRGVRVRARACLPVASALRQTQRGTATLAGNVGNVGCTGDGGRVSVWCTQARGSSSSPPANPSLQTQLDDLLSSSEDDGDAAPVSAVGAGAPHTADAHSDAVGDSADGREEAGNAGGCGGRRLAKSDSVAANAQLWPSAGDGGAAARKKLAVDELTAAFAERPRHLSIYIPADDDKRKRGDGLLQSPCGSRRSGSGSHSSGRWSWQMVSVMKQEELLVFLVCMCACVCLGVWV